MAAAPHLQDKRGTLSPPVIMPAGQDTQERMSGGTVLCLFQAGEPIPHALALPQGNQGVAKEDLTPIKTAQQAAAARRVAECDPISEDTTLVFVHCH